MGIQGLLPFLANSTKDAHISEFENEFVAIDAYCWLHKGIYSCAIDLAMKKPTTKYVTYCMRYIEMLLHFKVKPILVFDGRQLSSKCETEKKRREERKRKYEKGKELMRAGKVQEGRKLLGESVDVTHELALNLIQKCREKNIDCIVAPYEADSQLAFLSLRNIVKCIITEDSDLLAYGCDRVMFKMDVSGRGKLIEKSEIHISLNMAPEDFSEDMFRYMCILSGCDYLPSLPSIGPANALKFIKMLKDKDFYDALPRLPIYINRMNVRVPPEYIEGFKTADRTFMYQLVYDPFLRKQVPLRPTNDDEIVGTKLPDDVAFQLAIGNIDPITMRSLSNYDPDQFGKGFSCLWRTDLLPKAVPRSGSFSSHHEAIEAKKRQRENLESDNVESVTSDLKKQRTPLYIKNIKNISAKKTVQKIPITGFIFEPKITDEKKEVSKPAKATELLKSRYFSRERNKGQEKKQINVTEDQQKGESYENYLQRLYDECFPVYENENEESKEDCYCDKKAEDKFSSSLCPSCKKCPTCCSCFSEVVNMSDSQKLGQCIREIEEYNGRQKSDPHILLNEIYKSDIENSKEKNLSEDEDFKDISSSESLRLNLTEILSRIDEKECPKGGSSEVALPEKENSEIICESERKPVRSPSPVFRVQKDAKVLSRNCRFGNISDTANTPRSIYFSSADSRSFKESDPILSRRTPSTHRRTISSVKSFSSVPSKVVKTNGKSSSVSRTLFQFGFKKERRNEID